jgi:hypothetical protein
VDEATEKVLCTNYSEGKRHDFRLLKDSKVKAKPKTKIRADTGYTGLQNHHPNSEIPKRRSSKKPLSKEEKINNQKLRSQRALNEHVIGKIKRFKVVSERYRNRRKRFALRFNLIAGIYNYELDQ